MREYSTYMAYFIGGQEDLTKRAVQQKLPKYEVLKLPSPARFGTIGENNMPLVSHEIVEYVLVNQYGNRLVYIRAEDLK